MRVSSWIQISTGVCGGRSARRAFSVSSKSFIGLDDPRILRGVARPRADVEEAELFEQRSHMALVKIDVEALPDDAFEVEASPARDAVDRKRRSSLNGFR